MFYLLFTYLIIGVIYAEKNRSEDDFQFPEKNDLIGTTSKGTLLNLKIYNFYKIQKFLFNTIAFINLTFTYIFEIIFGKHIKFHLPLPFLFKKLMDKIGLIVIRKQKMTKDSYIIFRLNGFLEHYTNNQLHRDEKRHDKLAPAIRLRVGINEYINTSYRLGKKLDYISNLKKEWFFLKGKEVNPMEYVDYLQLKMKKSINNF
jgi:hypothetical protein